MNKLFMWYISLIWLALLIMWFEEGWTVREYLTYSISLSALVTGGFIFGWKYSNTPLPKE